MKIPILVGLLACLAACAPDTTPTAQAPQTSTTPAPPVATAEPKLPAIKGTTLKPVDEGPSDSSFAAFRKDLLDAVQQRDAKRLIAALDPDIRTSFGGGGRIAGFREQWSPDNKDSAVWAELETILTNGGTFLKGGTTPSFWAPYVYSAWPDGFDAFEYGAVMGENIPLRESPANDGKTLGLLSYNIVKLTREEKSGFLRVQTEDGRSGWVGSAQVRSPIGYRAGFIKSSEGWKMNALVAGD
jgi:hypothetical protein